jgi:hypothetical protein
LYNPSVKGRLDLAVGSTFEEGRDDVNAARRLLLGSCAAVALAVSTGLPSATATTQPGKTILVYFIFTDKKLLVGLYREGPNGANDLYLGTPPKRGDYGIFTVMNRGHKTQTLTFMHKTYTVKVGQKDRFTASLLTRGSFPYSSPSSHGNAFSGIFKVY